jgi:putative ABC transport system permease protein
VEWLRILAARLRGLFCKNQLDEDLDAEFRAHLEMLTEENIRRGMTTAEARYAARRDFGGIEQAKESYRDQRGLPFLETLVQDMRYALRMLRRSLGFTTLAVLILGLGIGANAVAFSVLHAVLLRPLPYGNPKQLTMLSVTDSRPRGWAVTDGSTSYRDFLEWRRQAHTFEDLAIFYKRGWSVVTLTGEEPEKVQGAFVSANFFALMGVQPLLGHAFSDEDLQHRERVVMLSYGLWQSRFGGSLNALGQDIYIDGKPWRVVGVMPPQFRFPFLAGNWENHVEGQVQLWAPLTTNPSEEPSSSDPFNLTSPHGVAKFQVIARLNPKLPLQAAQAEMNTIAARLALQYPDSDRTLGVQVRPLNEYISGEMRRPLLLLSLGVLLLLLLACTNLATLFLARGVARARELAVRAAIGATRWRVIRQLLTESVLLGIIAGGAGVLLAGPALHLIVALSPLTVPRLDETRIDATVLVFSFTLALLCGLGFGLAPARRFSAADPHELLKTGQQLTTSSTFGMQGLLVGVQFALSLVLLTSASLLIRSFVEVLALDPGFQPDHILTIKVQFANPDATPPALMADYYQRARERLRKMPGVQAVGTVGNIFFLDENQNHALRQVEGHAPEPVDTWTPLVWTQVSGDYFRAMAIPLLQGRYFASQDGPESSPVAIINQTLAKRYWPGEDPIGKRLKGFDPRGRNDEWVTVVGLVADMRSHGLERVPMAEIYEVQSQRGEATPNLIVRVSADPMQLAPSIRSTLRSLDKSVILSGITTMQDVLREQTVARRFQAWLMGVFSALALLLAAVGVYGVMHYFVTQRIPEIGVRMALGARGKDIVSLFMRRAMRFAGAGLAVGLVLALWSASLIKRMLFGVANTDPLSFLGALSLLILVALAATYLPARRATRVDPMAALRYE